MSSQFGGSLALAGALLLAACGAQAESISLPQALQRSLENNPGLRAQRATLSAVQSQADLDALAPPLTLSADLENLAGSGSLSGVRSAESTLRLGRVIELGGKREARIALGSTQLAEQRNSIRQAHLDLALQVTQRYIGLLEAQAHRALAQGEVQLAQETAAAVRQRVQAGIAPELDLALSEIAVARADIDLEHAEHELASSQFALAALWGESELVDIEANATLLDLPDAPKFADLAQRLLQTPEADAFTLQARRLEASRRLAESSARPDLSLNLGVKRLEALDDQALVLSFAMPFGSRDRASHSIAKTTAELEAVAANSAAAQLEARQSLYGRVQELRHARTEFEALTERMIPAAERGLELTRAGYEAARYSWLHLNQAQSSLLQLRKERLAAASRYHTLLAEIERSTAAAGARP